MEGKHMCKVSVLTPVYNVKTYLRQCLDSLVAQTLDDIEFICIDDGSTDGCSEILDAYAEKDARFRVIHKTNSGYGASMNVGLRAARGEYIGIVESDDFAEPEMFAELLAAAEEHQAEIVKSNFYDYGTETGSRFHELLAGCPYGVLCSAQTVPRLLQTDCYIWTSMYRKDFLERHGIWFRETPGAAYQDVSFYMRTVVSAQRMFLLKKAYLHYRRDHATASVKQKGWRVAKLFRDEFCAFWDYLREQEADVQRAGAAAASNMWRIYKAAGWEKVQRVERPVFAALLAHDLKALEADGYLQEALWPEEDWHAMQRLLHAEAAYAMDDYAELQRGDIVRAGFFAMLAHAPQVYVCGAGRVAQWLLHILDAQGITPAGILVSRTEGNPPDVAGVPVSAIVSATADREHDLVVIAVTPRKPEIQQEIFCALSKAGYQNVLVLTRELQEALSRA